MVKSGQWQPLACWQAWDGNGSWDSFIAHCWRGSGGERLLIAVNYASHASQCYVDMPFPGIKNRSVRLQDLLSPADYIRDGNELLDRGLYLDLQPWSYHVFELEAQPMKAITVEPKKPGTARYEDFPEPDVHEGSVLVEAVAVGVCGTDVEIVEGKYGWAPPGKTRLVLGHESLGRVIDPGPNSSLKKGDLVVGIVRRPDPVPCPNCAVGEWDMCRNGQYTERGIKEIHGYMSERWRIEPEYAIKVDPSLGILGVLLEPTTVITKALEQVAIIGRRSFWEPRTVLVTGAGPIGLLAALAAKLRGLEVHVLDRMESGLKPDLVRALGATYHSGSVQRDRLRTGRDRRVHRCGIR